MKFYLLICLKEYAFLTPLGPWGTSARKWLSCFLAEEMAILFNQRTGSENKKEKLMSKSWSREIG